jgi:hypothetical protein
MATLTELQTDLITAKATRNKILTGAQKYNTKGQEILYPSLVEINKLIKELEKDINRFSRNRIFQIDFSKMS